MNFNPRAPCGARPRHPGQCLVGRFISTHAPLAGRDDHPGPHGPCPPQFQPTRPLRGATTSSRRRSRLMGISTHAPLAGRDPPPMMICWIIPYFNPRAPCGARRAIFSRFIRFSYFNPRAPCGARQRPPPKITSEVLFQPTRPLRGATRLRSLLKMVRSLFQPTRPLRGATRRFSKFFSPAIRFQPTRPLRGAT